MVMTDEPERDPADLERRLLDERRERDAAQRRVAQLVGHVELWRTRAEERTERIKKLEIERDKLRGVGGWFRRRRYRQPQPGERTTGTTGSPRETQPQVRPVLPAVRCVSAVSSPDLSIATGIFDTVAMNPSVSLMEPDIVIVDGGGFAALPSDIARSLVEWASSPGRPPLAVTDSVPGELARQAQSVLLESDLTGRFFDPSQHNPITPDREHTQPDSDILVEFDGFGPVVSEAFDPASTVHLQLAARGIPFLDRNHETANIEDLNRRSVQYRRYAFERRTGSLEHLFEQTGLDAPPIRPKVAGILVSNRPEDASKAIDRLRAQRVPNFEVVVGCHGFSASVVSDAIDRLAAVVPVTVLEFDSHTSLGACLNRAITHSGADVVAKMDDDDHYGPAYLIDAVQALMYSGAPIVGKGTSYAYLESEDRTVIRRPGNEERYYNGSPTGATLVWKRSLWEENPFAHRSLGEDLSFLRGARRLGHAVYVNSVYEFVYHRRRSGNTWQAADALFLEGSESAWAGESPDLADVPDLVAPG